MESEKLRAKVGKFISKVIDELPEEERAEMAEFIATMAVISGSYNIYEGIGILESSKLDFIKLSEEAFKIECGVNKVEKLI